MTMKVEFHEQNCNEHCKACDCILFQFYHINNSVILIIYLIQCANREPEDDVIGVETCRSEKSLKYNLVVVFGLHGAESFLGS